MILRRLVRPYSLPGVGCYATRSQNLESVRLGPNRPSAGPKCKQMPWSAWTVLIRKAFDTSCPDPESGALVYEQRLVRDFLQEWGEPITRAELRWACFDPFPTF